MSPIKYTCAQCVGDDDLVFTAYVTWNEHEQRFQFEELTKKTAYCRVCLAEVEFTASEVTK